MFEALSGVEDAQRAVDGLDLREDAEARELCIRRYSFAIPCVEAVRMLLALSPLVEVGAGSGYWSRLLKEAGADVVSTDIGKQEGYSLLWGCEGVEELDAVEAVRRHPDRNVFVCWPSYKGAWAADMALEVKPGRTLAVIGEGRGGCTADDRFFDALENGYDEAGSLRIPRWDGIYDALGVHVRRVKA